MSKRKQSEDLEVSTKNKGADEKDIKFSVSDLTEFPVTDLAPYLHKGDTSQCKEIARLLHKYGILIIKDPRVPQGDNEEFIDMMEKYYERSDEDKKQDIRKELYYQVGLTPTMIEQARNHCDKLKDVSKDERPLTICPPGADPKVRFFWRMGEIPPQTEFKQLNADPVVPQGITNWAKVMNSFGNLLLNSIDAVSEMAAIGLGLEKNAFTSLMKYGPHLLAPTGSDLGQWNKLGTVFASYHYDLNFLTIHGKSRFPGLFVWTREGKKMLVRVPNNCLLIQAGIQFEWLTGGEVLAGFHEVVVTEDTLKAVEKAKKEHRSLWRISSTLFGHIASDSLLQPLGRFANEKSLKKYPPTKAGIQVQQELDAINLGNSKL